MVELSGMRVVWGKAGRGVEEGGRDGDGCVKGVGWDGMERWG